MSAATPNASRNLLPCASHPLKRALQWTALVMFCLSQQGWCGESCKGPPSLADVSVK